jgi:alpha 1,3-glucosidase
MRAYILCAIVNACVADPSKFKVCESSPFCSRFKAWSRLDSRPIRSVQFCNINSDQAASAGLVDFTFTMKSSIESESNYAMTMSLNVASGSFRIIVDDARHSNPRVRYRIPPGDVIVQPKHGRFSEYTYTTSTEKTSINVFDFYSIDVRHDSFTIKVYNKVGDLVQVINSNNIFAFEKYRQNEEEVCPDTGSDPACHPDIDSSGAWMDQFGTFKDIKKYGPSLVGIDVEHYDAVSVHGLPEHTTDFTLPFSTDFRFYNSDVFEYPLNSGSALYGSIPLLTSLHTQGSVSAVLWLNPSDTFVSLEKSASGISSVWTSETGVLDIAILVGPTPADVLQQYHYLTGLPTLPPIFALGYHQSKWGYKSQKKVMWISKKFIKERISMDVVWLDIQYTDGKKYFTWDPLRYGDPTKLISSISEDERKLVTIIDPHIKVDHSYSVFMNLFKRDYFVKEGLGEIFVGQCWPGYSAYPDFTRSDVRQFWGSLYSYDSFHGTSSDVWIWNDMNEPSVFDGPEMSLPRSVIHHNNIEHREIHNLYGMYYHRSTYEGLLQRENLAVPLRPFVLSRSFFLGSHRFGPIWTGDNDSKWSHLQASIPMLLSLSISGMSFSGADVGGFFGNPTKELYIRWHQAAASFYPFYRCHAHLDSKNREPWTFDPETTMLVRQAISLRYMLLPYWYTQFALYAIEGLPIIRPMWFDHMLIDPSTFNNVELSTILERQIMIGDRVLVRPVVEEGVSSVSIYLPDATSWWYTLNGSHVYQGGQTVDYSVTIATVPVFVKSGTILPLKKKRRMSTKKMKTDPYTFRIYEHVGSDGSRPFGSLYMDDETTMDYVMNEKYSLFQIELVDNNLVFTKTKGGEEGPREPGNYRVEIINREKSQRAQKRYDDGSPCIIYIALVGTVWIAWLMHRHHRWRFRFILTSIQEQLLVLVGNDRRDN